MSEEIATLGGGCFWCLEAVFKELRGVTGVLSGYAGGHVANPNYSRCAAAPPATPRWCRSASIPPQLDYADLLRVFFTIHDPTTKDRQGNDVGPQYRSIILTHSDAQAAAAKAVMQEIAAAKLWPAPLVTQIEPLTAFYPAEAEHTTTSRATPGAAIARWSSRQKSRNSARRSRTG